MVTCLQCCIGQIGAICRCTWKHEAIATRIQGLIEFNYIRQLLAAMATMPTINTTINANNQQSCNCCFALNAKLFGKLIICLQTTTTIMEKRICAPNWNQFGWYYAATTSNLNGSSISSGTRLLWEEDKQNLHSIAIWKLCCCRCCCASELLVLFNDRCYFVAPNWANNIVVLVVVLAVV